MDFKKETVVASFLYDLDIFLGERPELLVSRYQKLFQRYLDVEKLTLLLNRESNPLQDNKSILLQARELSIPGIGISPAHFEKRMLASVFSKVSIDGVYPSIKYYRPEKLSMEAIFPVEDGKVDVEYHDLLNGFYLEMDQLAKENQKDNQIDFNSFLVIFETVLKKFLWAIPATKEKDEDISLYDHVRVTAAIASAMMEQGKVEKSFFLVAGHFSGIQNYIFSSSKAGASGAAKRLRARSFYVNAMVSALAYRIVHKFGLNGLNILMLTGGKFYILLPNVEEAEKRLENIETKTSAYLYQKFKGGLSLDLVWQPAGENDIVNYSSSIHKLSEKIEKGKNEAFHSVLKRNGAWDTDKFFLYDNLADKAMCKACRSALVDAGDEEGLCSNCATDTEIGRILPKADAYSFSCGEGEYELLDGYYLNIRDPWKHRGIYLVYQIYQPKMKLSYQKATRITYTTNYVPTKEDDSIKTFSEIAQEAEGMKKIGALKADVDTLGYLFTGGLVRGKDNLGTISRLGTMSRMLDMFFSGHLQKLVSESYKNIYCVFSGGDDLFLLGPWSEIPDLALQINKDFHTYTGGNKDMTISAAIHAVNGNEHIAHVADHCEESLTEVKNHANSSIHPDKKGRDGVFFYHEIMAWKDFRQQIEHANRMKSEYSKIGVGILRRLKQYSSMYKRYCMSGDVLELMYEPMYFYDRKKNYGNAASKCEWFQKYSDRLSRVNYRETDKDLYYAALCIGYVLDLTKEDRGNGEQ